MYVRSSSDIGLDGGCIGIWNFVDIGNGFIGQESGGGLDGREGKNFHNIFDCFSHGVEEVLINDNIKNKCKRHY